MERPQLRAFAERWVGRHLEPDVGIGQRDAPPEVELRWEAQASSSVRLSISWHDGKLAGIQLVDALRASVRDDYSNRAIAKLRESRDERGARFSARLPYCIFGEAAVDNVTGDGKWKRDGRHVARWS